MLLLMNDFEVLPVKDIDEMFLEASLKGCIEIGLKAELLAAKKYVDFYVSGFGEGCGSGKLKYSFTNQSFSGVPSNCPSRIKRFTARSSSE